MISLGGSIEEEHKQRGFWVLRTQLEELREDLETSVWADKAAIAYIRDLCKYQWSCMAGTGKCGSHLDTIELHIIKIASYISGIHVKQPERNVGAS